MSKYYHVVRDTMGKTYVFDSDKYDMIRHREFQMITIDRTDDPTRYFGWFAPGQWVSAFSMTEDELAFIDGND